MHSSSSPIKIRTILATLDGFYDLSGFTSGIAGYLWEFSTKKSYLVCTNHFRVVHPMELRIKKKNVSGKHAEASPSSEKNRKKTVFSLIPSLPLIRVLQDPQPKIHCNTDVQKWRTTLLVYKLSAKDICIGDPLSASKKYARDRS